MIRSSLAAIVPTLMLCAGIFPATAAAAPQPVAAQAENRPRLILLGTAAGPVPRAERSQPASLLAVGGKTYLIDAGDGVSRQFARARISPARLDAIFVSHLHFDHILGLGPVMAFSWIEGRTAPLPLWGPPGLDETVRRNADALETGANIFKPQLPPRPPLPDLFAAHEISLPGPVAFYDDGVVKVTATANSHYAHAHLPDRAYGADRSYSYRFDTPAGAIVFTGDTGPSAAVEALARDCNILVAEVVDLPSVMAAIAAPFGGRLPTAMDAMRIHMEAEHLTPAELGKLAQRAKARKLIVTHFAMGPTGDLDAIRREIRRHYTNGDIVMGMDMMEIPLE